MLAPAGGPSLSFQHRRRLLRRLPHPVSRWWDLDGGKWTFTLPSQEGIKVVQGKHPPDSTRLIEAGGDDELAVRRKGRLPNFLAMTAKNRQQAIVSAAPEPRCMVVAGSGYARAVG